MAAVAKKNNRMRVLAYVRGLENQELLRNAYPVADNRIPKAQIKDEYGCPKLTLSMNQLASRFFRIGIVQSNNTNASMISASVEISSRRNPLAMNSTSSIGSSIRGIRACCALQRFQNPPVRLIARRRKPASRDRVLHGAIRLVRVRAVRECAAHTFRCQILEIAPDVAGADIP